MPSYYEKPGIKRIVSAITVSLFYIRINDSGDSMTSNQSWYTFASLYGSDLCIITEMRDVVGTLTQREYRTLLWYKLLRTLKDTSSKRDQKSKIKIECLPKECVSGTLLKNNIIPSSPCFNIYVIERTIDYRLFSPLLHIYIIIVLFRRSWTLKGHFLSHQTINIKRYSIHSL